MKYLVFTILALFLVNTVLAQPPLSKRDQKKKAEFEAMIAAEEKYEALMVEADQAFKDKDYVKARMTYEEAIQYNADKEQWLISKVNDLDILMARNIARKVDSILVLPSMAAQDVGATLETRTNMKEREAPEPLPLPEEEVSEEIVEEKVETAAEEVPVEDKSEELVEVAENIPPPVPPTPEAPATPKPKPEPKPREVVKPEVKVKVKDDFADLPQGMTEDEFDYPDHHVWRIVVKDGIDTIVYKRVKHRWGGDFCFKDDVSISKRIWNEEIEAYRQKFDTE